MERKIMLLMALTLIFSSTAFAQYQDERSIELSLYGSYWDVKDGDDNVWGPGFGASVYLLDDLAVDLKISWFPDMGRDNYGDIESVPYDFGLSYHFELSPELDLSLMGGATYAMVNFDPNVDGLVDIDNTWGAYAGGGFTYYFTNRLGLFSNVYYRFMEFDADVRRGVPFLGESTLEADGIGLDVGFKFAF